VGAQKSGSTVLFLYMMFHPNFTVPTTKEAHFFDMILPDHNVGGENSHLTQPLDAGAFQAAHHYLNLFPMTKPHHVSTKLTGDATPSYVLHDSHAKTIS